MVARGCDMDSNDDTNDSFKIACKKLEDFVRNELPGPIHYVDEVPRVNKRKKPQKPQWLKNALNSVSPFPFHNDIFQTENNLIQGLGFPHFDEDMFEPARDRLKLKYINAKTVQSQYNRKFQTHMNDYKILLKKNTAKSDKDLVTMALKEMFEFAKYNTKFQEGDQINIVVQNPNFFYPISTGFETKDHIQKLKEKICQIITSDKVVDIFECTVQVQVVNPGSGRRIINLTKDKHTTICIVQIKIVTIYAHLVVS